MARPWNDESPDAFLRLERGRTEFLRSATEKVSSICGSGVFSPAMFRGSTHIWARAGYEEVRQLEVMERPLGISVEPPHREVREDPKPDWNRLLAIDQAAFEGFWRMSVDGLREALASTSPSSVLTVGEGVDGYAIVGSQWGIAYLQRVAVDPDRGGRGLGTDLIRAAVKWGQTTAAGSMVLNVRLENERARRVYESQGFTITGTNLHILRYGSTTLLN